MKRYLILAETSNIGYFVEIHHVLPAAKIRLKRFFELAFNPPTDREQLYEEFKIIGSYPINEQYAIHFRTVTEISNGFCTTWLLEIDKDFSFEVFKKLRNSSRKISFPDKDEDEVYQLSKKYGDEVIFDQWAN